MSFFRPAPPELGAPIAKQAKHLREASKTSVISTVSESAGLVVDKRLEEVYRQISLRIIPTFMLVVLFNQIDRNNLAFAALTMNRDLKFSTQTYGLGAAAFFLTFCVFAVPSNLVMVRVGVRRWLSFLVIGWGVVASCSALVSNVTSFYTLRLLLGVFEAGAIPVMWFQLTQFYPQERLTKPFSWLMVAVLIANIVGAPLAAGFLAMDGIGGLHGWQWLFVLEGVPSVILGVALLFVLPDCAADAKWLTDSQKELLQADMAESVKRSPPREDIPRSPWLLLKMALSNPLILYMSIVGFLLSMAAYTYIFFLPIIINSLLNGQALGHVLTSAKAHSMELKPVLLTSIPYTFAAILSWVVAHHSQRRKELYWHVSGCFIFGGVSFLFFPLLATVSVPAAFASLTIVAAAVAAGNGPSHAIANQISAGPSQVLGMPLYSSIAVLGGFVGPFTVGAILQRSATGFTLVCYVIGAIVTVAGIMIAVLKYLAAARERRLAAAGQELWYGCGDGLPVTRKHSGPDFAAATAAPVDVVGMGDAAAEGQQVHKLAAAAPIAGS